MNNETCLLEVKDIVKTYGGVEALKGINLKLYRNEILAVVGDNGAGKSTLMKIISGAIPPDSGKIFFNGMEVVIRSPIDSMKPGIQMCYQHLALIDCLDIQKNLFLGRELLKFRFPAAGFLDSRKMREMSIELLRNLGINIGNVRKKVRDLSGGQRQVIAISSAIYWGSEVIILDEPTAALGVKEARKVMDLIQTLKTKGISVIIISHNLQHVFYISDRIAVLRQGSNAGERKIQDTDGDEVVRMITGAEYSDRELIH